MSEETTSSLEQMVAALLKEEIILPQEPIELFLKETLFTAVVAERDKDQLVAAGLNPDCITILKPLADFLRVSEADWTIDVDSRKRSLEEWNTKAKEGEELQATCKHYFSFAMDDDPDLKMRVKKITEGSGNADMIQDLSAYFAMGNEYPEKLTRVGFDLTILDRVGELAKELYELSALNHQSKKEDSEVLLTRNKAYTILKRNRDEVRKHGKFVFWRDKDKLDDYKNQY